MAEARIFLSSVSAEFRNYRDALRYRLDRLITVRMQEDFITTGTETLDILDEYIQRCDVVIHLSATHGRGDGTTAVGGGDSRPLCQSGHPAARPSPTRSG
jgi:hypothetical protein